MKNIIAGLGLTGFALVITVAIGMMVGWFLNIYKLFGHLPLMDTETIVRLIGLVPVAGGIVGWF